MFCGVRWRLHNLCDKMMADENFSEVDLIDFCQAEKGTS